MELEMKLDVKMGIKHVGRKLSLEYPIPSTNWKLSFGYPTPSSNPTYTYSHSKHPQQIKSRELKQLNTNELNTDDGRFCFHTEDESSSWRICGARDGSFLTEPESDFHHPESDFHQPESDFQIKEGDSDFQTEKGSSGPPRAEVWIFIFLELIFCCQIKTFNFD